MECEEGAMAALPPAIRRLCVAVDVVGFTARTSTPEQIDVQSRVLWVMIQACKAGGIAPARCDRQDSGDGQILIFPPGIDEARAVPGILLGLLTALYRVNHPEGSGGRVRLRFSMGQGAIQLGPLGFAAPSVVTVCRLLDSAELRAAVAAKLTSDVGVIVTADLYHDVVGRGYGGLPRDDFSQITVDMPAKRFHEKAWLQVPDPQPLLATVPDYREPTGVTCGQLMAGGLLSLGAAAALIWAALANSPESGDSAWPDVSALSGHPLDGHFAADGAVDDHDAIAHGAAFDSVTDYGEAIPEGEPGHHMPGGAHLPGGDPGADPGYDDGPGYDDPGYDSGAGNDNGLGYDDGSGLAGHGPDLDGIF
jgi:hypothetical protein